VKTFIEDHLVDPSQAIANAAASVVSSDHVDENSIYEQLDSPEFKLYEAIIFS
jgi:hypothetical protein